MEMLTRDTLEIGNAIRRKRRLLTLTQSDIAELSGCRQATISAMEKGESFQMKKMLSVFAALKLEIVIRDRTKAPRIEDIF